jgi:hypothetical protein
LSPYTQNDTSDEEEGPQERVRVQQFVRGPQRNDDGSWLTTGGLGQTGLSPDDRRMMGDAWVPSIEEMVEQRFKNEKKLEVQEWLTKSEVGSEAGDIGPSNNFLKPITGRRRAKSHNDVQRRNSPNSFGLGVRTDFGRIDDTGIPGPGVYIDERSDYGDYDYEDDASVEPDSPPAAVDVHLQTSYFPPAQESVPTTGAVVKPWVDAPTQTPNPSTCYQPPTSNAAMMRFRARAKDVVKEAGTALFVLTLPRTRLNECGNARRSTNAANIGFAKTT